MIQVNQSQHRIINGDCRVMKEVMDESMHLVITSPPYWQLKDYNVPGQIGYGSCYEDYINDLNLVWQESHRVLHKGCRLCVNIGDQFARASTYGRYKVIPIRQEIIKGCESIGFDYMGAIIWQKITTTKSSGGGVQMGSYPYPRNGILKIDYEFILLFKKLGSAPKPTAEQKKESIMTADEWNTYFSGHWSFPGCKQDKHIAMFPEELPFRLIKMFSFVGEDVLDPFMGSGTTALAAGRLGRNSIGYELNPNFIPVIQKKLTPLEAELFADNKVSFEGAAPLDSDPRIRLQDLPYRFVDIQAQNATRDPKAIDYGAVIEYGQKSQREKYLSVRQIHDCSKLCLSNGDEIILIGVDPIDEKKAEAISFLENATKGKRIYIRRDPLCEGKSNVTPCYLFLENKTFINAHLIKRGFARPALDYEYKNRNRFAKMHKLTY